MNIDENELFKFFNNVLFPITPKEAYFISTGFRKKYLTEEQRSQYKGDFDMVDSNILADLNFTKLKSIIYRFYPSNEQGYLSSNLLPLPTSAQAVYCKINPSDSVKATEILMNKITDIQFRNLRGHCKSIKEFFSIRRAATNSYQLTTSKKGWFDFDIDIEDNDKIKAIKLIIDFINQTDFIPSKDPKYIVDTHGGFHVLILVRNMNPYTIEEGFRTTLKDNGIAFKEIKNNTSTMIPVPGTLQGGHLVTINSFDYYNTITSN